MKITLIVIGKTNKKYVSDGLDVFVKRLKHYVTFEIIEVADIKNNALSIEQQKKLEAEKIIKYLKPQDLLFLLDEKGSQYSSIAFSSFLQEKMNRGVKNLVFAVGGAYGFCNTIKSSAHGLISLSAMTFSHQMIRLLILEQIYRAFTILKNEPYHNE